MAAVNVFCSYRAMGPILRPFQENATLDLEGALLGQGRCERVAAVDVLVLNRRLERAERDRPVEVHVGRRVAVVVLRVVGAADREDLLRAVVPTREGDETVDLGIEEVVLQPARETRFILDARRPEPREHARAIFETVAEEEAA